MLCLLDQAMALICSLVDALEASFAACTDQPVSEHLFVSYRKALSSKNSVHHTRYVSLLQTPLLLPIVWVFWMFWVFLVMDCSSNIFVYVLELISFFFVDFARVRSLSKTFASCCCNFFVFLSLLVLNFLEMI